MTYDVSCDVWVYIYVCLFVPLPYDPPISMCVLRCVSLYSCLFFLSLYQMTFQFLMCVLRCVSLYSCLFFCPFTRWSSNFSCVSCDVHACLFVPLPDDPPISHVCPAMCTCANVIDGVERFQGVFKRFVSFDAVRVVDNLYVVFMASAGFVFILQLLAHSSFNKFVSIIGQALKVRIRKRWVFIMPLPFLPPLSLSSFLVADT